MSERTRGRRILVVDDDRDIRDSLALVLETDGYSVTTAANGQEALQLLYSQPLPSVILLDLMMPVMSGWQLLQVIGKSEQLRPIPIIVLSASDDLPAEGVACVLRKPFDLGPLLDSVDEQCRRVAALPEAPNPL
jgi:CheY-like chemotaxis protein